MSPILPEGALLHKMQLAQVLPDILNANHITRYTYVCVECGWYHLTPAKKHTWCDECFYVYGSEYPDSDEEDDDSDSESESSEEDEPQFTFACCGQEGAFDPEDICSDCLMSPYKNRAKIEKGWIRKLNDILCQ
jgi:hypothetical protein